VMIVGVIPARGGSVGIPRKNLQKVGGLSLLERSILFAQVSCDVVVVSSDDREILGVAKQLSAIAIQRPSQLSTGKASSESAVIHAVEQMNLSDYNSRHETGKRNVIIGLIQATTPFQESESFSEGLALVELHGKNTSVFSAIEDHSFLWEQKRDQTWSPLNHSKSIRPMRQDLSPRVRETGGFYIFHLETFLKTNSRFSQYVLPVMCDPRYALDIDTRSDLEWANTIASEIDLDAKYLQGRREATND
jgi:CMP-N-acetylneuraminic acid synthetase